MASPRRSLGPAFGALWAGTGISNLGDGMRLAALPLLAVAITDSPALVAGVTTAQRVPWLVFGPVGGALVDRWRRRETILVVQGLRAALLVGFTIVVATGRAEIWQLYVVTALVTAGEILVDPAIGALVPTVVEPERLDAANSRISGTEIVTNEFVGAPVGAALFAIAPWAPFAADAATYGLSTAPLARVERRPASRSDTRPASGPTSPRAPAGSPATTRWVRWCSPRRGSTSVASPRPPCSRS
ncbi:MAG: MFS transporter [Actinomycetota bacterium]|nr:MFS transporter [Actinomycetota bacterium]